MAESQASKSQSQTESKVLAPPADNENENENPKVNSNATVNVNVNDSGGAKYENQEKAKEQTQDKTGRKNVKLPLVLWKTWLHRKHHFCCFACELITPVLMSLFVFLMLSKIKSSSLSPDKKPDDPNRPAPILSSEQLVQKMVQDVFRTSGNFEPSLRTGLSRDVGARAGAGAGHKQRKSGPQHFVIAYAPANVSLHDEIMRDIESILVDLIKQDGKKTVEIRGFSSEGEIEKYFQEWDLEDQKLLYGSDPGPYGQAKRKRQSSGAVNKTQDSFVGAFILNFPEDKGEWSYKIRLHDGYYTSKYDTLQFYPHSSRDAFPNRLAGKEKHKMIITYETFVGFQVLMDLTLLSRVDGGAGVANISLTKLPNPRLDDANTLAVYWYFYFVCATTSVAFLSTLIQTVRGIASEKESGFKEILKVHGLGHWVNVLGWICSTIFVVPFGATVITLTFSVEFFKHVDGFMMWITMFCYGIQIMAIGFFIASICTKALFATIVAFVVWLGGFVMGLLLVTDLRNKADSDYTNEAYVEMGTASKFFLSILFPEVALSFAFNIFAGYEGKGDSSSWSKLYTPFASWDGSSIGLIWLAMLVSIFFYIILGTYLENILPSNYGARKPIFYPFYKSTWCSSNNTKIEPKDKRRESLIVQKSGGAFEPDPVGLTPGVSLYELTKVYGKKRAVDGVSLHIYEGQITVLLGHNGAGKSTLVSMTTGLTTPTKGTAVVQGCDIRKDLNGAQQSMSICPQENMQANTFTVMEHLRLFALLKGSSFSQSKAQAKEWVQKLKLEEKANTSARKLSGGMRRRLQLGMSLIGGNHVVFLDEPSSGLDPQTRREVWDILMNYRGKSTIVLSTHYMEEADVLGDRIVIMRDGQFQCCGSPLFLKGIYGIGYTLHVTINRQNSKSQNQTPVISPTESKVDAEAKASKKTSKETIKTPTTTTAARRKSSRKAVASSPKLNKEDNEQNAEILSLVKSHFPGAQIVKSSPENNPSSSTRQLDINIPQAITGSSNSSRKSKSKILAGQSAMNSIAENTKSAEAEPENGEKMVKLNNAAKFPTFFKDLESNSTKLGIAHSSLTFTTLDDVFEKAGAQLYSSEKEGGENEGVMNMDELESIQVNRQNLGCKQFRAFLLKKLGITGRKWGLLAFQVLLPALFMILALCLISRDYSAVSSPAPVVKMSVSDFDSPVTPFTSTSPELTRYFKSQIGASAREVKGISIWNESRSALKKDIGFFTFHHILAADLQEKDNQLFVTMYASQMAVHSQPLAINVATNTILKKIRGSGKQNQSPKAGYALTKLTVKNHALRRNKKLEKAVARISFLTGESTYAKMDVFYSLMDILSLFLLLALVPVVVTFIFVPAQEKVTEWKHLQVQMTGASPWAYWGAFFIIDFLLLLFIFLILATLIPIFKAFDFYTPFAEGSGFGAFFLVLVSFGYSNLCIGYFASARAKNATSTITFFILFHFLILMVFVLVVIITISFKSNERRDDDDDDVDKTEDAIIQVSIVFQMFPSTNFLYSLHRFNVQAQRNVACGFIPKNLLEEDCKKPDAENKVFSACCSNCTKGCLKFKPILEGVEFFDVGRLILTQFAVGTFFLLLLIFKESRITKKCCRAKKNSGQVEKEQALDSKVDEDVIAEIKRVQMEVEEKKRFEDGDIFLINQLSKAFRKFQAVKNITLGVRKDQCFGLLGPNGCGKTTLFRMLAGQEIPDAGNAFINVSDQGQGGGQGQVGDLNCNLAQSERKFLSNIGYCPQFDAFSGYLTGKEMLLLMGRLRGIEEKSVSKVADQWLLQMGLEKSAKVQCRKYSGGMKRKLSTALSLIGSPKLVLLDEPSTGVDPHARRQFWKVLASAQKAGQSIILTSHSMDECEALCSSLCIMINGKMQCLGGVEHLKHKFAIGHDLTIKLAVRIPPRPQVPANQNPSAPNQTPSQNQRPAVSNQNSSTSAAPSKSNSRGPGPGPSQGQIQVQSEIQVPSPGRDQGQAPGPVPSDLDAYYNSPQVKELLKLKDSIQQGFAPCILKDEHENILQYQIQNTLMPWSTLFQTMEEIKERHKSLIQEYTLQETTLEQVFLSIAKMQFKREEAKSNCCKSCCLSLWSEMCS